TYGGSGQTTAINAGTLQVDSDADLGNAATSITFGGGTLQATGSFASSRNVTLNTTGTIDTNGNSVTLMGPGVISGPGGLVKAGAGTLALTGVNTYQGGTTLNAGTTVVTSQASLGSVSGGATLNAATLEIANSFTSSRTYTLASATSTIL